jgi:hypothetical protein
MAIDLGDDPGGTPPSPAEKLQIRTAIGLGQTDAPTFAGLTATGALNFSGTATSWNNSSGNNLTFNLGGGGMLVPRILTIDSVGMLGTDQFGAGLNVSSAASIGFSDSAAAYQAGSPRLFKDDTGILAQRNGSSAQAFRVYNDYGAGVNFSRFALGFSGGVLNIGVEQGGTGANLGVAIKSLAGVSIHVGSPTTPVWNFASAGHLLANLDGFFDIGASGANRPRNIYVGTSIDAPLIVAGNFRVNNGAFYFGTNSSVMTAPSNGVIRFTDAGQSTFTRLELGTANLGISRGTGSPEGVVTALVGSLYIRTDGGAATTLYVKESSPTPSTGWVAK